MRKYNQQDSKFERVFNAEIQQNADSAFCAPKKGLFKLRHTEIKIMQSFPPPPLKVERFSIQNFVPTQKQIRWFMIVGNLLRIKKIAVMKVYIKFKKNFPRLHLKEKFDRN